MSIISVTLGVQLYILVLINKAANILIKVALQANCY